MKDRWTRRVPKWLWAVGVGSLLVVAALITIAVSSNSRRGINLAAEFSGNGSTMTTHFFLQERVYTVKWVASVGGDGSGGKTLTVYARNLSAPISAPIEVRLVNEVAPISTAGQTAFAWHGGDLFLEVDASEQVYWSISFIPP